MAGDKILVTDLNDRERARFARLARAEAEALGKLADSLESAKDAELLMSVVMVVMSGGWHADLVEALKSIQSVEIPSSAEGAEDGA